MLTTTTAIILRRRDIREVDRLCTAYTDSFGKLDFIARGVRKNTSRLAASLEPLTVVALTFVPGRRWPTITGSEIIERFRSLTDDLWRFAAASALAEIVDQFTRPHQPDPRAFLRFRTALHSIDATTTTSLQSSIYAAAWKLLAIFGFAPRLDACAHCRRSLVDREPVTFSGRFGGILCSRCRQFDPASLPFPEADRQFIAAALRDSTDVEVSDGVGSSGGDFIQHWVETHGAGTFYANHFLVSLIAPTRQGI